MKRMGKGRGKHKGMKKGGVSTTMENVMGAMRGKGRRARKRGR